MIIWPAIESFFCQLLGKTRWYESYFLFLRREPDWTSRTASYKVSLETLLLKKIKIKIRKNKNVINCTTTVYSGVSRVHKCRDNYVNRWPANMSLTCLQTPFLNFNISILIILSMNNSLLNNYNFRWS